MRGGNWPDTIGTILGWLGFLFAIYLIWLIDRKRPRANAAEEHGLWQSYSLPIIRTFNERTSSNVPTKSGEEPLLVCARNVKSKPTDWIWPGVIASGSPTLLGSEPKMGKSQVAIYAAAVVSCGRTWPDGSQARPGSVVIAEKEDGRSDAVLPRLHAAGADVSRVHLLKGIDLSKDMDVLARHLEPMCDLRLLVLSPFITFFGPTSNDENTVRARIQPMLDWAEQRRVGVLGIVHILKGSGRSDLFSGSDVYRKAARATWSLVIDQTDPEPNQKLKRRLMVAGGVNNAADGIQFPYHIEGVELLGGISTSRVVFAGATRANVESTAQEVPPSTHDDDTSRWTLQEAQEWLCQQLAHGPLDSEVLMAAVFADGLSMGTLARAADSLNICKEPIPGTRRKMWSLPY